MCKELDAFFVTAKINTSDSFDPVMKKVGFVVEPAGVPLAMWRP